jgi:hypothetical protein
LGLCWAMSCTASKSIAAVSVARRCHLFTGQAPLVRSDCDSKPGSGRLRDSAGEPHTGESSLPRMKRRQSQKWRTRVSVLHDQIKCQINGHRSGNRAPRGQVYRTRFYRIRFILPGRHWKRIARATRARGSGRRRATPTGCGWRECRAACRCRRPRAGGESDAPA